MSAEQQQKLFRHLFSGDGYEAAAIILCGRRAGEQATSTCREVDYYSCRMRGARSGRLSS